MDIKVKQRVVGALVLIGLVAIFLPIVFHGSNMKTNSITMTRVAPPAPPMPHVITLVNNETQRINQVHAALLEQQPAITDATPVQPWLIQVAGFKDKQHAVKLQQELKEKNIQTYISKKMDDKILYYCLLSGPYANKQQAQLLLQTIHQQTKLTGILVPFS